MKIRLSLALAVWCVSWCWVTAQTAGERYFGVYSMIKHADALAHDGQVQAAVQLYNQARETLLKLKASYPGWNTAVIDFRLQYIDEQLKPLLDKLQARAPAGVAAPTVPGEKGPAPPAALPPAVTNQLVMLRQQIAELSRQNELLQAKLKEALAVRPAAVDPQELARAQERIRELEKERDLLRTTLEQQKQAAPPAAAKPGETASPEEQEKALIKQLQDKLQAQTTLVASLQQENQQLRRQLEALRNSKGFNSDAEKLAFELEVARNRIALLEQTNVNLRASQILLEQRLAELTRQMVTRDSYETVKKERDELADQLEDLRKELARARRKGRGSDLEQELEAARARLRVFEAKREPYSAEELALLRDADVQITLTQTNRPAPKVRELPPGAGPLITQARLALNAGRLDEAESKLEDVLRQDKDNPYVLGLLALVQLERDRLEEAEKNIQRALKADPQDPAALFLLGRLRYQQKRYDEAFDALSLSATLAPEEPNTQFYLGRTLMQRGNREAAESALRRAVKLAPNWGEAHYWLAMLYAMNKPPLKELAQWHYRKALSAGYPRSPQFEQMLEQK